LPLNDLEEYRQVLTLCRPSGRSFRALLTTIIKQIKRHRFEDIVGAITSYLKTGIISVLVTNHIPRIVAEEFKGLLPLDPKDEYPGARRIKRKFFLHLGEPTRDNLRCASAP
jgi:hypothetical protein